MSHTDDFVTDIAHLHWAVDQLAISRATFADMQDDGGSHLPERLPDEGVGGKHALALLVPSVLSGARRLDHRGYFAHMDPPTPWVTWAAAMWVASANQNLLHPDTAPRARSLERCVISWLLPFFGMDGAQLLPSSTLANLVALWVARDLAGVRRVVTSSTAHVSIEKAARLLGMQVEYVPCDTEQRLSSCVAAMDLSDAALVLTAGTTSAGAIDDLSLVTNARWRHVDAAWAGPLRMTRHAGLLDGIERADSVSLSLHKWLYQPKESAIVMFANMPAAESVMTFSGSYLATPNVGLLGSHGALPAAALAATLLSLGRSGVASLIESGISNAQDFSEHLMIDGRFEVWRKPEAGVVLWRPKNRDPSDFRLRLQDASVSLTRIDGEVWLRSVAANPLFEVNHIFSAATQALR